MQDLPLTRVARESVRVTHRLARPALLAWLTGATVLLAVLLLLLLTPTIPPEPATPLVVWAALLGVAHWAAPRMTRGAIASVAPAVDFAAILCFGPIVAAWLDAIALVGARGLVRRQAPLAVAAEMSVQLPSLLAAGGVFGLLGDGTSEVPWPAVVAPHVVMVATYYLARATLAAWLGMLSANRVRPALSAGPAGRLMIAGVPVALASLGLGAALAFQTWGVGGLVVALAPLVVVQRAAELETRGDSERHGFSTALVALLREIDPYTSSHSLRVAAYAERLAQKLGAATWEVEQIRLGALLHDVGKAAQERHVLVKPARLSEYEQLCMQSHPGTGARLMAHVPSLREVADIVRHHHERIDGRGYPDGLAGEEIPLGSRIVLVADAFDAMTTDRAYRPGMAAPQALAELERGRGTQFDARIVDTMRAMFVSGEMAVIRGRIDPAGLRRAG